MLIYVRGVLYNVTMKWLLLLLTLTPFDATVYLLSSHETMAECYHAITEVTLFDQPEIVINQEVICVKVTAEVSASFALKK